jgi:hypothetical protein
MLLPARMYLLLLLGQVPRGLFGRLALRQSMFDPLNAISSSYLVNAQARKKAKQAAAAKAALAEAHAQQQQRHHSMSVLRRGSQVFSSGHLGQSESATRSHRSFARQTTLMSAAQASSRDESFLSNHPQGSEVLSPRHSLEELEATGATRRQVMMVRPALKHALHDTRSGGLGDSGSCGGGVPPLALPLGPTRSLPLLPSITSPTQAMRAAAGPHHTKGGPLMSGHSVPSLPLLQQSQRHPGPHDTSPTAGDPAQRGAHAPMIMPHHLKPLPFATPRQRADLESRLTSGDLLPK